MGAIWLYDLPDWLADAGLNVRTWDGWETRSRSSGGYDAIYGIVVHHTASSTTPDNDCNWEWSATGGDQPIGAMLLDRTGRVTVGAAGATNCAGKGGPWTTSRGTVPQDKGNQYTVSIEAANAGTGETWPTEQLDAYLVLVSTLCDCLGLDPVEDVCAHFEWAPTRKIDPAGPPRYASGGASWNMNSFRADVLAVADGATPTPEPSPEPEPEPTPTPEGDWMANLPTIKKGDSNDYVARMQHLLAAAGYMNPANTANYDGVWGNGTDGAKQRFDVDHGLAPSPPTDCGDKSWESLMTGKRW